MKKYGKGYSVKYGKRQAKSYIDPIDSVEKWKIVMKVNETVNVASMESAFDAIYDTHVTALGHEKVFPTNQGVKKEWSNVSRNLVILFCKACPVCNGKRPSNKKHEGAVKPIRSVNFRDRMLGWGGRPSSMCSVSCRFTLQDSFAKLFDLG
jgi:hypothetical protein